MALELQVIVCVISIMAHSQNILMGIVVIAGVIVMGNGGIESIFPTFVAWNFQINES